MLSPLLYNLFTHNCLAAHYSNTIIKFADTTVAGLITDDNETCYRVEGQRPGSVVPGQQPLPQRQENKGADCGLQETERIQINEAVVERIKSFKYLGVYII